MSKTIREIIEIGLEVNGLPFDATSMLSQATMLDETLPKSLSMKSRFLIASALAFSSIEYYNLGKKHGEKI